MSLLEEMFTGVPDWEGTVQDLSVLCVKLAAGLGLPDDSSALNERLIRYYVQVGIVSRPQRRGKEAYFGLRQAVELLTARMLARDGWPLAKLAEFIAASDIKTLMELFPGNDAGKKAHDMVRKFKAASANVKEVSGDVARISKTVSQSAQHSNALLPSGASVTNAMASQSGDSIRARSALQKLRMMLGGKPIATRRELIRIELAPWCQVDVDVAELRRHPPEIAEMMGKALAHQLAMERLTRRRK
jgi:DNA-binding transcriptional MerR regulator